ncbi:hypothetical protein L209DRAFT_756581 [Thermothelomyces heterothallicus CBS 203.75]
MLPDDPSCFIRSSLFLVQNWASLILNAAVVMSCGVAQINARQAAARDRCRHWPARDPGATRDMEILAFHTLPSSSSSSSGKVVYESPDSVPSLECPRKALVYG